MWEDIPWIEPGVCEGLGTRHSTVGSPLKLSSTQSPVLKAAPDAWYDRGAPRFPEVPLRKHSLRPSS